MGSEHLNEQEQQDRAEAQAQLNRRTQQALEMLRQKRAGRHLSRRPVAQAQPASPPDGRRTAQMDAERICRGLNVDIYRRADAKVGGWCWSLSHDAFDELEKNGDVPIEGGPLPSRKEAAEDAVVVLAQALGGLVRQLSTHMPSVRS